MKPLFIALVALCFPVITFCQDITGLWTGSLHNEITQQDHPYEIYISKEKGKYTAYSYTSFTIDDKQCFGVKKVNVRIAKDGKVVIQDASLIENNSPTQPNKNVIQLNVLNLKTQNNTATLEGEFVTNRTTVLDQLTGRISLTKTMLLNTSNLVKYFNKTGNENYLTALK